MKHAKGALHFEKCEKEIQSDQLFLASQCWPKKTDKSRLWTIKSRSSQVSDSMLASRGWRNVVFKPLDLKYCLPEINIWFANWMNPFFIIIVRLPSSTIANRNVLGREQVWGSYYLVILVQHRVVQVNHIDVLAAQWSVCWQVLPFWLTG